ncbi:gamma-crystallin M1-like [Stylophora pistillata]|uniref:gamma-crystallin M1-like n=1 Tax=Stylophora pistillata TaxID=50429 RepID=UPI000C04DF33|nr:gamma-crystallin M1-like [Stylophora pistillata]
MRIQVYENPELGGRKKEFSASCEDLTKYLPKGAASILVPQNSEPWQIFTDVQFEGEVEILYPGDYETLNEIGLKSPVRSFRKAPQRLVIKLFENREFGGNKKVFFKSCDDLTAHFPEGALSAIVNEHCRTGWELYSETHYGGAKVVLKPGNTYPNEGGIRRRDSVKSFRKAHDIPGPMLFRQKPSAAKFA